MAFPSLNSSDVSCLVFMHCGLDRNECTDSRDFVVNALVRSSLGRGVYGLRARSISCQFVGIVHILLRSGFGVDGRDNNGDWALSRASCHEPLTLPSEACDLLSLLGPIVEKVLAP